MTHLQSIARPQGQVSMTPVSSLHVPLPPKILPFSELLKHAEPKTGLDAEVNAWREANIDAFRTTGWFVELADTLKEDLSTTIPHFYGRLFLTVGRCRCNDPASHARFGRPCPVAKWLHYGLASVRVVTDVGVNFIVDAFQNLTELENMKFHGIGQGSNAEAAGDVALDAELTTQYNPDNTRATGSTTEGASANIYRTVGTNTVDAAVGIEEHGIFDQADTTGGVLLDRSVFAVINLGNGDSLQSTYDLTINSGG